VWADLLGRARVNACIAARYLVFIVVAGVIAAITALETRASAAVRVAISVTTISAAAFLGVAAGIGEVSKSLDALGC
jgi:CHASE2 domain-containing sensor protein